jgi:quercetin dioxygenase-like cupin family protein
VSHSERQTESTTPTDHVSTAFFDEALPENPDVHVVSLLVHTERGPRKEVTVLLDTPQLKLLRVTLREGTMLPMHSDQGSVTLQPLVGKARVKLDDRTESIGPYRMLNLAPNTKHEVTPEARDLVMLLHVIKKVG